MKKICLVVMAVISFFSGCKPASMPVMKLSGMSDDAIMLLTARGHKPEPIYSYYLDENGNEVKHGDEYIFIESSESGYEISHKVYENGKVISFGFMSAIYCY